MNHAHAIDLNLLHRVDASKAAQYLTHVLECERWYVVCHHEHQLVIHVSGPDQDRYALSFECTPPVEKGIYHGSMTSHLSILPLHSQPDLPQAKVDEIKAGLARL